MSLSGVGVVAALPRNSVVVDISFPERCLRTSNAVDLTTLKFHCPRDNPTRNTVKVRAIQLHVIRSFFQNSQHISIVLVSNLHLCNQMDR